MADPASAWTRSLVATYVYGQFLVATGAGARRRLAWDELDVFQLDAGGFAGRLRVSLDTLDNATELARLLSSKPNVEVRTNGTFLVAALSDQPVKPDWLFGPLVAP